MTAEAAFRLLLLANAPVALFAAMATFAGLFGLAAPEPNPARWFAVSSPILLAIWLAAARQAFDRAHATAALAMLATPVIALGVMLLLAVTAA